jgi:phage gp29-like protein
MSSFMQSLVARMRTHLRKSTVGWLHDTINPLWNISSRQAQMMYDFARSGNYAQLEYLYNEIENCSPVFNVCVTRRTGALSELGWKVVRSDERLNRNADANLVKEQIECVEDAIAKIDNLPEALEHFALSAFRGFSVASVWRGADGLPTHLECLDHWNICRDMREGRWLWNPGAVSFVNPTLSSSGMHPIPPEDSVAILRKREIDWPAMKIFLREAIGERDWGRFMETYGLPPVIITMPEFTNDEDKDKYLEAAVDVFEGRSGVVPYGSQVNFASESRGVNPFTDFVDHQMKMFVLLSTGGTLTSLTEATGIGSGASETQMDTWKQIVRADVRIVSNAINQQLCKGIIERNFKGKPMLAEFRIDTEPQMTAKEVAELASAFSGAGYEMDAAELSQLSGFTIRKKQEGGGMGFNAETTTSLVDPGITTQAGKTVVEAGRPETSGPTGGPLPLNAGNGSTVAPTGATEPPRTPQEAATPQNRELPPEPSLAAAERADAVTPQAEAIGERLVRSLQDEFKDVADEIAKVLALPEDKRAGAAAELLAKIDGMVSDDPAMAEVIEEQMREAFRQQLEKQPEGDAPAANKAIPN